MVCGFWHCVIIINICDYTWCLCDVLFRRVQVFDTGGMKMLDGIHQTNGIDVYVSGERTILLDSQVLISLVCVVLCSEHCSAI